MSASARDMCDLYRAEMALEHACEALGRAGRALPLWSEDKALAKQARHMAVEFDYLNSLVYTHSRFIHELMMERHGGDAIEGPCGL